MFFELASQFKGYNNGDLQATWKLLKPNAWASKDTIQKSLQELERYGWIVKTRQGGLNKCSLFAITFLPINGHSKLDMPWDSYGKKYPAPNNWRNPPDGKQNATPLTGAVACTTAPLTGAGLRD